MRWQLTKDKFVPEIGYAPVPPPGDDSHRDGPYVLLLQHRSPFNSAPSTMSASATSNPKGRNLLAVIGDEVSS